MIFRQYQLSCLSLFSYLIGDEGTGRAVVVDPQRRLGLSRRRRRIRADDRAGDRDPLPRRLPLRPPRAGRGHGRRRLLRQRAARTDFPMEPLADGERLSLGDVVLEIRHTPGHTPESIAIVVWEHPEDDEPWGVLTGDTMFIGDVGRPDLLSSAGWTADDLAGRLYHSLRDQLLTLPDGTRVYPAHGAGSACGKAMSDAVTSTIGEQRQTNYALRPMAEHEFVAVVTEGQSVAPPYFAFAADANRHDHQLLDDNQAPQPITLDGALELVDAEGVLLDARPPAEFASGHLRGAINVGLEGRFAEYAGDVIRPDQPIVVVAKVIAEPKHESGWPASGSTAPPVSSRTSSVLLDRPDLAERSRLADRGRRVAGVRTAASSSWTSAIPASTRRASSREQPASPSRSCSTAWSSSTSRPYRRLLRQWPSVLYRRPCCDPTASPAWPTYREASRRGERPDFLLSCLRSPDRRLGPGPSLPRSAAGAGVGRVIVEDGLGGVAAV